MATLIQYDFFETREESERKANDKKFQEIKEGYHSLRKFFFAHRAEDKKEIKDLSNRLDLLEKYICTKT